MRREGRQHGWVFAVDRSLVDPEGRKIRTPRSVQVEGAAAANGGGFVKAPRKPTNHSKPAVGRAYKALIGKGEAGSGSGSGRGRHKFRHDEVKMYYQEAEGAGEAYADAYEMDA
ncbi:unnamed protein product [Urochloa decumbens]|uniref:Uncharacterized protein n=1 Tax=Urochloa decumbens TaxID=240449 RepID=A0ABC8ZKC9_9POAL